VTVTHRIRIRRRSDMTTRHRLRQGDRLWRIAALSDDASRRFLTIDAEERRD
jgi:head-tail adaptor